MKYPTDTPSFQPGKIALQTAMTLPPEEVRIVMVNGSVKDPLAVTDRGLLLEMVGVVVKIVLPGRNLSKTQVVTFT